MKFTRFNPCPCGYWRQMNEDGSATEFGPGVHMDHQSSAIAAAAIRWRRAELEEQADKLAQLATLVDQVLEEMRFE